MGQVCRHILQDLVYSHNPVLKQHDTMTRSTQSLREMQVSCLWDLARMSFHQVNMFIGLEWSSQQISALRSVFQMSVQRAFAIFVNYDTSDAHFLQSLPQHSCMLS